MPEQQVDIETTAALVAAVAQGVAVVRVAAQLIDVPTLQLHPGQAVVGFGGSARLAFGAGQDGLELCSDNCVEGLELAADPDRRAIFNDTSVDDLGRLELRQLRITGCVRLLAADRVRKGHVEAHDVHILAADARGFDERPAGFGVEVVPGVFTVWNRQVDPSVTITADLTGLSIGLAGAPVRGGGVFVAGAGDVGGRLLVARLETGEVHSDGGIAPGTPDRISGGVFTVSGAVVDQVRNRGPVTTYGPNDMVLDNWGVVDRWTAEAKITSYGPSGIGFVNFGSLRSLQLLAPIETFGGGARGFNIYAGSLVEAEFDRVVTHGDGAVGVQISQPVGCITVRRGIETHGGVGDSLVKGVVTRLAATALSIKPGGAAREVSVSGGLVTHGAGVEALELHGVVEALTVQGGLEAAGKGFASM
ncbi:hypothetical protein [Lichenicola sp.]|uniref:hypothetical protein n=1 Tax=Lichenicola sp. TaxID=2804529 RepID=UPI003B00F929